MNHPSDKAPQRVYYPWPECDDEVDFGSAFRYRGADTDTHQEFLIDRYLHAALFGLEIVDRFDRLPSEAPYGWGPFEEPALYWEGLQQAARILRECGLELGDEDVDLLVEWTVSPRVEYRVRCPAELIRQKLDALATFLEGAYEMGSHVRFLL